MKNAKGRVNVSIDNQEVREKLELEKAREHLEQFVQKVARSAGLYGELRTIEAHTIASDPERKDLVTHSVGAAWHSENPHKRGSSVAVAYFNKALKDDSHGEWMSAFQPSSLTIYFSKSYLERLDRFRRAVEKHTQKFHIDVDIRSQE